MQSPVPNRPPLKLSIPANGGQLTFYDFAAACSMRGIEAGLPPAAHALILATRAALTHEKASQVDQPFPKLAEFVVSLRLIVEDIDNTPSTYEGIQRAACKVITWLNLPHSKDPLVVAVLDILTRLAGLHGARLRVRLCLPLPLAAGGEVIVHDLEAKLLATENPPVTLLLSAHTLMGAAAAGLIVAAGRPLHDMIRCSLTLADEVLWSEPEKGVGVESQAATVLAWLALEEPEALDLEAPRTDAELVNSVLRGLMKASAMQEPLDLSGAYSRAAEQLAAQGIDVGHKPAAPETDYRALSSLYGLPGGV